MQAVIGKRLIETLKPDTKPYEVRDTKLQGFILRVQPTGKMSYVCQYGRAKRINLGPASVLTPAEARDRVKEILADVLKGADPQAEKRKAKAHTLESYLLNVYTPWVETHHRDGRATMNRLKANFLPLLGKVKLGDITPWTLEKWRSERIKAGSRPATVNRYLNPLKAALSRAVDWGLLETNPLIKIKPMKTDSKAIIRYLSDDEEDRLRKTLESREARIRQERESANNWREKRGYDLLPSVTGDYLKPMVILTLNTGLRRGELFNLKWEDIDLDQAMLAVKGHGAKSGQTRHIPLNSEAVDILRDWQAQGNGSDLIFPGRDGQRFDNINKSW